MDMPIPDDVPGDLKLTGDIINAPREVIDKISSFIPPGTRGIVIQISNMTGLTLALKTTDFASGGLEPSVLPAPVVGPFSQTVFGVKSTGIATSVVGSVIYESAGIDLLLCGFNSSFFGRNAVNVTLKGPLEATLGCQAVIGSGNHTAANFVLFDTGGSGVGERLKVLSEIQREDQQNENQKIGACPLRLESPNPNGLRAK
jgi:hypothetical protein